MFLSEGGCLVLMGNLLYLPFNLVLKKILLTRKYQKIILFPKIEWNIILSKIRFFDRYALLNLERKN